MGALFWGLLLIILGLSMVLRIVFNIDFPVFKVLVAFIFIYIGLRMLFGSFGIVSLKGGKYDTFFSEKTFNSFKSNKEYNVIFGEGIYDFRNLDLDTQTRRIKISTIFGSSIVKIPSDIPVRIKLDAAFAGGQLPNGNTSVFGNTYFESPDLDINQPHLDLKIDVVFGSVRVIQ